MEVSGYNMYDLELITELEDALEGFGESKAPKRKMYAEVTEIKKTLDRAVRNASKAMKKADYRKAISFCDEGIDAATSFKDSITDMTDEEIKTYHGVGTKATLQALLAGLVDSGINVARSKKLYNDNEDAIVKAVQGIDVTGEDPLNIHDGLKRNTRKGFNIGLGAGAVVNTMVAGGVVNIVQRIYVRMKTKKLSKDGIIADIDTVIEALDTMKATASNKLSGIESFIDIGELVEALSVDGSLLKGLASCGISDDVACEMYIELTNCYYEMN